MNTVVILLTAGIVILLFIYVARQSNNKHTSPVPKDSDLEDHINEFALLQETHKSNNLSYPISNKDLIDGPYIIDKPGYYYLTQNITFDKFIEAFSSPAPFQLGNFAAIIIQANNVVLDLKGFTIKQSKNNQIQQRFYANIELGSSPFISGQGPSDFGDGIIYPKNIHITNGTLGLSSHHGIHGIGGQNVLITDLEVKDFEVAGISLNGFTSLSLHNIDIHNNLSNVPFNAKLSQILFMIPLLKKLDPSASITFVANTHRTGRTETVESLLNKLQTEVNNISIGKSPTFTKSNGLFDGHVYGLALNTRGVMVNGLATERLPEDIGNENIILNGVSISNLKTSPVEVIGLKAEDTGSYSGVVTGPVGDVFRLLEIAKDGVYIGDPHSDSQLIIAQEYHLNNLSIKVGTKISQDIINWAKDGSVAVYNDPEKLLKIFNEGELVYGRDSMAHIMKGTIGLFLSKVKNILSYDEVKINGVRVNYESDKDYLKAYDVTFAACSKVDLKLDSNDTIRYVGNNSDINVED